MKMYFDIGANAGDYTQYLLSNGAEKVICVEANPYQAINLRKRFIGQNVIIVNKAISDIEGKIDFYICPECDVVSTCDEQWRTNSRFSQPDRNWVKIEAETISIDKLIEEYGIPTHMKIDVEGYEYHALLGMTKNYCQLRFEWSEEKQKEIILSIEYLMKIGYSYFGVMIGDDFNSVITEYITGEDIIEYIKTECIPSRKDLWGMIFCLTENDEYVQ